MALPKHVAIIMDGNGRWAQEKGLPRAEGHRQGAETIDLIVEAAHDRGIANLTLYAFSEENWSRPLDEVVELMKLLGEFLVTKRQKMIDKGIRFHTIGNISRLPKEVQDEIRTTCEVTKSGDVMNLIVALSYGARQEICTAVNELICKGMKEITPQAISQALDTSRFPDPDLLIRTSNELRLSNFLLWQCAYTEFYFTDTLWPDFDEAALDQALENFAQRERRFGMTGEQIRDER
jgi:undecaprenyl diphosphate synthase